VMAATSPPRQRLTTRIPLLIWIVALSGVVIGSVVGLAELDDGWTAAAAIVAGLAAITTIAIVARDELAEADQPLATRVLGVRPAAAALGAVAVAALAIAVYGGLSDDSAASTAQATPASAANTVRDFIIAASVGDNGEAACGYLTTAEQASVGATGGVGCRQVLNDGIPSPIGAASDAAVRALHTAASVTGGRATVRLGTGNSAMSFVLERATAAEQSQFNAPGGIWRIAGGATSVLHERGAPK
jgi:hypothetical protein